MPHHEQAVAVAKLRFKDTVALVGASAGGVVFVDLLRPEEPEHRRGSRRRAPATSRARALAALAVEQLEDYLGGQRAPFTVPVDLSDATPFARDVYRALMAVPAGEIVTYGELAALAGHPRAARAVGCAMHRNPTPIFVPCHRVVAAAGRLGGWSGPTGWKERLLRLERAPLPV